MGNSNFYWRIEQHFQVILFISHVTSQVTNALHADRRVLSDKRVLFTSEQPKRQKWRVKTLISDMFRNQ